MREAYTPDSASANIVFATCLAAEHLEEATALLTEMSHEGLADQVTYNTLLKAYARAGKLDKCFEVYESMYEGCVVPSQVTYGLLLDGCVHAKQPRRASEVFAKMQAEGCPMNTVMYTTLIRGFERAGDVDKAMEVYRQMLCAGDAPLDAITFSILIKANCDAGRVEEALRLLEALVDMGLKPDGVVFNNLLSGSVKVSSVVLGRHIYSEMIQAGVRPTNVTFSTLVTLFVQCKHFDEAVTMLKLEPGLHGVELEPRVCMQLMQSCIRERQGRRVVKVYLLMFDICNPTAESHATILVACIRLKMFDTASEIFSIIADRSGSVNAADAEALLEVATRKGKKQCVRACLQCIATLGLNVPSALLERGRLMEAS
jgi:pentatricopeptide repeat protein